MLEQLLGLAQGGAPPMGGMPPMAGVTPPTNDKDPVSFISKALNNAVSSPQSLYMLAGMGMKATMENMPKLANSFMDVLQMMQGGNQQEPGSMPTPPEPQASGPAPGGPVTPGLPSPGMPGTGAPPGMGAPPLPPVVLAMLQNALAQRGLGRPGIG